MPLPLLLRRLLLWLVRSVMVITPIWLVIAGWWRLPRMPALCRLIMQIKIYIETVELAWWTILIWRNALICCVLSNTWRRKSNTFAWNCRGDVECLVEEKYLVEKVRWKGQSSSWWRKVALISFVFEICFGFLLATFPAPDRGRVRHLS